MTEAEKKAAEQLMADLEEAVERGELDPPREGDGLVPDTQRN